MRSHEVAWLIAICLAGCASRRAPGDDAPTLASLAGRQVQVRADEAALPRDEARAIAAYQDFLAAAPASSPQRSEAMRRLGDLEIDLADKRVADGARPDYGAAIDRYQAYLAAHPQAADRDAVLYQLARAQEQGGALERALATLDTLVRSHPGTRYRDEAEFRRGELLFSQARWTDAEAAFATVLQAGAGNPYLDRALYMQGWSRYKQGRLDAALYALLGVLDLTLGRSRPPSPPLSRADQELVDDTLRVVSLALEGLQGAASIAPHVQGPVRMTYEPLLYEQLAALYQRQGRHKDAADTLARFARLRPQHAEAPVALARGIEIVQAAGFDGLALQARTDFVLTYAADGPLRGSDAWRVAQPRVRRHLAELAQHHHALAQRSHAAADVDEAVRWYRAALQAGGDDAASTSNAAQRFLLAELLFEAGRFAEALPEYEASAYAAVAHDKAADAGYAALLVYDALLRAAPAGARTAVQRAQLDSARRFAAAFAGDARVGGVLAHAAETAWTLGDGDTATALARQTLGRNAEAAHRRVAHAVLGHAAFDDRDFAAAEAAYAQALALTPAADGARGALAERLAAAIYRQGEAARDASQPREAAAHFARVAQHAPGTSAAVAASFDAAVQWIALEDWSAAERALTALRRDHPQHRLAAEVAARLALVYGQLGRPAEAAREFDQLADRLADADPEAARSAAWQAATLYDRAAEPQRAARAWERYVQRHPAPLPAALEARWRLAQLARADGRITDETRQLQLLRAAAVQAEGERVRTLAGLAALRLAEPLAQACRAVPLVEPLKRNLERKKARFDAALKAFAQAADGAGAEVEAASTWSSAQLYRDFGRAVRASQRPRGLRGAALEQYAQQLEALARPFDERALELLRRNAERAAHGQSDEWVRRSVDALAAAAAAPAALAARGERAQP